MAETTEHYHFTEPDLTDFADITVLNENFAKADAALYTLESAEEALKTDLQAENLLTKIKSVDGEGSGLDADLLHGQAVVAITDGGTGQTNASAALTALLAGTGQANLKLAKSAPQILLTNSGITRGGTNTANSASGLLIYDAAGAKLLGYLRNYYRTDSNTRTELGVYAADGTETALSVGFTAGNVPYTLCPTSADAYSANSRQIVNIAWLNQHLAETIQTLLEGGEISVIKSIQRGVLSTSSTTAATENGRRYQDVAISAVNTAKAFVVVNSSTAANDTNPYTANARLTSSKNLRIYANDYAGSTAYFRNVAWQVVEFY